MYYHEVGEIGGEVVMSCIKGVILETAWRLQKTTETCQDCWLQLGKSQTTSSYLHHEYIQELQGQP